MTTPVRLQLSRRWGFNRQRHSLPVNGLPAVAVTRPGPFGNRSVTNDVENVLQKIEASEGRSFADSKILYRDNMGFWDGLAWDGCSVRFLPLHERSEAVAYDKLFRKLTR